MRVYRPWPRAQPPSRHPPRPITFLTLRPPFYLVGATAGQATTVGVLALTVALNGLAQGVATTIGNLTWVGLAIGIVRAVYVGSRHRLIRRD